jgi:hypothetical protein
VDGFGTSNRGQIYFGEKRFNCLIALSRVRWTVLGAFLFSFSVQPTSIGQRNHYRVKTFNYILSPIQHLQDN